VPRSSDACIICILLRYPQALVASLHGSGVQATLVLQQGSRDVGSSNGTSSCCGSTSNGWACALNTGAIAVHSVGETYTASPGELGESLLGPALAAAEVASIEGVLPGRGCPL